MYYVYGDISLLVWRIFIECLVSLSLGLIILCVCLGDYLTQIIEKRIKFRYKIGCGLML